MIPLALGERHCVGQLHRAGLGRERRLDHQGSRYVAPLAAIRPGRLDLPVPALGVEDLREHRRTVVAGQAEPADRSIAVNQRGRVAVGQQAVVGDWPKVLVGVDHRRLEQNSTGSVALIGSVAAVAGFILPNHIYPAAHQQGAGLAREGCDYWAAGASGCAAAAAAAFASHRTGVIRAITSRRSRSSTGWKWSPSTRSV